MPFAGLPGLHRARARGRVAGAPGREAAGASAASSSRTTASCSSTDEERAAYDQMITLAHRVFPYVEGHKFYCEHWYTNLFFNKIREFGALLSGARLLRRRRGRVPAHALRARDRDHRPDDLLVERLPAARAAALAADRAPSARAAIAEWAKHDTPPALGPVPDVIDDPAIVMLWGITRESLDAWLHAGRRCRQQRDARALPPRAAWSKARRAS